MRARTNSYTGLSPINRMQTPSSLSRRTALACAAAAVGSLTVSSWTRLVDGSSPLTSLLDVTDRAEAGMMSEGSPATVATAQPPISTHSNFHAVYDDLRARDRFFLFLQNVYHLYDF